jgi:hypothetical protein
MACPGQPYLLPTRTRQRRVPTQTFLHRTSERFRAGRISPGTPGCVVKVCAWASLPALGRGRTTIPSSKTIGSENPEFSRQILSTGIQIRVCSESRKGPVDGVSSQYNHIRACHDRFAAPLLASRWMGDVPSGCPRPSLGRCHIYSYTRRQNQCRVYPYRRSVTAPVRLLSGGT